MSRWTYIHFANLNAINSLLVRGKSSRNCTRSKLFQEIPCTLCTDCIGALCLNSGDTLSRHRSEILTTLVHVPNYTGELFRIELPNKVTIFPIIYPLM